MPIKRAISHRVGVSEEDRERKKESFKEFFEPYLDRMEKIFGPKTEPSFLSGLQYNVPQPKTFEYKDTTELTDLVNELMQDCAGKRLVDVETAINILQQYVMAQNIVGGGYFNAPILPSKPI